jgi:hypothetical protein
MLLILSFPSPAFSALYFAPAIFHRRLSFMDGQCPTYKVDEILRG